MQIYLFLIFFMFGAIFGSFYYVVGYRIPKGESIVSPPSHCPKCNHRLSPFELIPIFSYILQLGKCKKCHTHISIFYPLFEIITGLLFGFAYLGYGLSLDLIIIITFISLILIVMLSDYYYMIIPDGVLIFFSITICVMMFFIYGIYYVVMHVLYAILSFCLMYLLKLFGDFLFKRESMGGGDIKLMFVFGLVMGFDMSIVSIFLASLVGLPISLILLRKNDDHVIPFGPYLGIGALIIVILKIDMSTILMLLGA